MVKKTTGTKKIIPIRLGPEELAEVDKEIAHLLGSAGIPISLGRYAKHAVMEHGRLRRIAVKLATAAKNQSPIGKFAASMLAGD